MKNIISSIFLLLIATAIIASPSYNNDLSEGNLSILADASADYFSNNYAAEALGILCPGDFNGDGLITVTDMTLFWSVWGTNCICPQDMNGDGRVSAADWTLFLGVWGTDCGKSISNTTKYTDDRSFQLELAESSMTISDPAADAQSIWVALSDDGEYIYGEGSALSVPSSVNGALEVFLINEDKIYVGDVTQEANAMLKGLVGCPGDFNEDGTVSAADLTLFLGAWGKTCTCPQDINGDGIVAAADWILFLGAWGTDCGKSISNTTKYTDDRSFQLELAETSMTISDPAADAQSIWVALSDDGEYTFAEGSALSVPSIVNGALEVYLINEDKIYVGDVTQGANAMLKGLVGCPGDFNEDGFVSAADLTILLGAWGKTCTCPEDMNGNEIVGASDLVIFYTYWGTTCGKSMSNGTKYTVDRSFQLESNESIMTIADVAANEQSIWVALSEDGEYIYGEGSALTVSNSVNGALEVYLINEDNIYQSEVNMESSVAVYPSPARDYINVSLPTWAQGAGVLIEVRDMAGNTKAIAINPQSKGLQTVDCSSLESGSYILLIQKDGKQDAVQFMVK